jgi:hypothetical protein
LPSPRLGQFIAPVVQFRGFGMVTLMVRHRCPFEVLYPEVVNVELCESRAVSASAATICCGNIVFIFSLLCGYFSLFVVL